MSALMISRSRRVWVTMSSRGLSSLALFSLLMLMILANVIPQAHGKGFHVTVEASWNETSLYQEGCEWAARSLGSEAFFNCLDALWPSSPPYNPHDGNVGLGTTQEASSARIRPQQRQYIKLLEVFFGSADPQETRRVLFEAEMAARIYSPAVEAHYDLAEKEMREASTSFWQNQSNQNQVERDGGGGLICGEPFGVVYTRRVPGAPLQAFRTNTPSELKKAARIPKELQSGTWISTNEVTYDTFDHRYSTASMSAERDVAAVVIVYGLPGCAASHALHRAAVEASDSSGAAHTASGTPAYFWRHLPVSVSRLCTAAGVSAQSSAEATRLWDTPLVVQGYGVTVDIKSTEYKVLDEAAAMQRSTNEKEHATVEATSSAHNGADATGAEAAGATAETHVDRVVGGMQMSQSKVHHPSLSVSLDGFPTLFEEEGSSDDVKVDFDTAELQDIGLAATQYISEVKAHNRRLHVLKEVVTRFPTYATAFANLTSQPARRGGLQMALYLLHQHIVPGDSAFLVEGWRVDVVTLFSVLDALHEEELVSRRIETVLTTQLLPVDDAGAATDDAEYKVHSVLLEPAVLAKFIGHVKRTTRRTIGKLGDKGGSSARIAYAIPENCVTWVNDVETAPHLQSLPAELSALFARDYDVTPFPRRNVLNYIFLWNPVSMSSLKMISLIIHLYQKNPLARYGVALADLAWSPAYEAGVQNTARGSQGESPGSRAAFYIFALAHHLSARVGTQGVLLFLVELYQAAAHANSDPIPDAVILSVCEENARSKLDTSLAELTNDAEFLNHYHETQAALYRFRASQYPSIFLNGILLDSNTALTPGALQMEMKHLRQWVSNGALRDEMASMYASILKLRGASDHMQPALLREPVTMRWSDEPATVAYVESLPYLIAASNAKEVPVLTQLVMLPCELTAQVLQQLLTVLAALESCDTAEEENSPLHETCGILRISLVSCPSSASVVHRHIEILQQRLAHSRAPKATRYTALQGYVSHLLKSLESRNADKSVILDTATVTAMLAASPLSADQRLQVDIASHTASTASPTFAKGHRQLWAAFNDACGGAVNTVFLVTNGRIVAMDDSFRAADVLMAAGLVAPLTNAVRDVLMNVDFVDMSSGEGGYAVEELDNDFFASKTACLSSIFLDDFMQHTKKQGTLESMEILDESIFKFNEERKQLGSLLWTLSNADFRKGATEEEGTAMNQAGATNAWGKQSPHHITVLVDPSSRDAQVIVSLAYYLIQSPFHVRLTVVLNPSLDVKFPIRNFYEYVASPALYFEETSGRVVAPAAILTQMPSTALLTLGVEEPPSWIVFSQDAEVDLDNVILSNLPKGTLSVKAVYRMHSILVTGDATDAQSGTVLNGLPLSLASLPHTGSSSATAASAARTTDTQVMANQGGYYQLQANPGLWHLSIKEGAVAAAFCIHAIGSNTVHECAEAEQRTSPRNWARGQRIPLVIDSFHGRYVSLQVRRTPTAGETADLRTILQEIASDEQDSGMSSWFASSAPRASPEKPTLNIFSVASGHLYERFLRMMMYSVHQTSSEQHGANKTRIKFWVIENFLSPQFKRYIPLLAKQIGFEVSFVAYRWPWWLPQQTEKQRKIWAYKILFLDVLFPLDVDRVIFVDADQTVQSDLHELYKMDIGGNPIAMTPFCQQFKNKATASLRFWEQGFWAKHLGGKPYHISAIFLVDLRRFRAMLAGDQYRHVYSNLVQDPNSLANLDQDLPNYLQSNIPIFSLKEEWLWCETWCSEESKSKAKTIDLCNNPLTKLPKLDSAKMLVPGWEELDKKLQNMSDSILGRL